MNEKYWVDQIAKKDAKIDELNEKLNESYKDGEYYRGLYIATVEKLTARVELDNTFEDILTDDGKAKKSKKK